MSLKQVIETMELLESATVNGRAVGELLNTRGWLEWEVETVEGKAGSTDFVTGTIIGSAGKRTGGDAPTLGIIGQLGGIGARPTAIGLVSDADGAITAIACALKLADLASVGDRLSGDVIFATHICPDAPIRPHSPVPFMSSPVEIATMNRHMVDGDMDAILSIDTTRGNWIVNRRGFAISPTVKQGYILRASPDLLQVMSVVTGQPPLVLPLATQDITPYGTGVDHINSIMQPATATDVPVVGVALTAETVVPGCASGASQPADIEMAVRFCVEVAKAFGRGQCSFYDVDEFERLVALYGSMEHLQRTPPSKE
jgi:hypothetical protein